MNRTKDQQQGRAARALRPSIAGLVGLLGLVALSTTAAAGEQDGGLRARFIAALSAYDQAPAPRVFRDAGDGALGVLSGMVEDETLRPSLRQRALLAMQYLPAERVDPIFRSVAVDPSRSVSLRRAAVQALCHVAGEEAVDTLARAATDPSPAVREAVIRGLRELADPEARELLEETRSRESVPWLRELATSPVTAPPPANTASPVPLAPTP